MSLNGLFTPLRRAAEIFWRHTAFFMFAAMLSVMPVQAEAAGLGPICSGTFYDPLLMTNWMDLFPITIAGISLPPGGMNPPMVFEPPICICPMTFPPFIPLPGIGITFWEPLYIAEVVRIPGCMPTLGGIDVFGAPFISEMGADSEDANHSSTTNSEETLQVHWYVYPLFEILNLVSSLLCLNTSTGYNLAFVTEPDPVWQNDIWAIFMSPEASLFSTFPLQMACIPDQLSSSFGFPIDALFWCAGTWGSPYPFSANANQTSSDQQANALVLSHFLFMEARVGAMWDTIGPWAECFSIPNPIWMKSQFRVDPIYPLPTYGLPINIGMPPIEWGYFPPENFPLHESGAYLIWNAQQCCLRP
ncbi:TraU family protein [Acidithiobacillus sp. M4-SHS-6]|uniref:TraU family protein n=1 Tax=Acidithiobacillus sp. M4-SHS-6 TaxID=3383024 RepID=UPI0039BE9D97